MRVLQDNYNKDVSNTDISNKPYPRKMFCERCESELEYDLSDLRMGEYGCMFLDCPCCGYDNMLVDNENNITLTIDNIEFPTHYHHISKASAVDICDNEHIRKEIKEGITYLRNNPNEYSYGGWRSGNLYVQIDKFDDDKEYNITVSNDFYNMGIPFDEKDYKTYGE